MSLRAVIQHFELPFWLRVLMVALGALILCSCRGPLVAPPAPTSNASGLATSEAPPATPMLQAPYGAPSPYRAGRGQVRQAAYQADPGYQAAAGYEYQAAYPHGALGAQNVYSAHGAAPPALPYSADAACTTCPPGGCPYPYAQLPYQPPEIRDSHPADEYLCDGGDNRLPTKVGRDFLVYGLDLEDTVAHYDTIDGRREVEASNKVCIYAPRFAAVRQVRGLREHEQRDFVGRIHLPVAAALNEETLLASQLNQPLQPVGRVGTKRSSTFRERNAGVPLENTQGPIELGRRQWLDVKSRMLATSVLDQADKPRLAAAIDAAITWSHDVGVGVVYDGRRLAIDTHDTRLGQTFVVESEGTPAIRIVKVASRKEAQPGDVVEFTLRFDNVGDELIGNVTILDNLTTRLEYVEDSQTCTLKSGFFVEQNEGESLALRWEIFEPMEPGASGVITFKCRVR